MKERKRKEREEEAEAFSSTRIGEWVIMVAVGANASTWREVLKCGRLTRFSKPYGRGVCRVDPGLA